ncbi:hypothetical protein DAERI_060089 [Deinococcus aerius]|uniref:Uncharacterized protein n=1 Tax=Deinococcus aerius TaxID=200253 RepID=A0A2I9CV85_9DEIO|nr:hypothetical protein [Deinococcus aerius]GBF05829.1 hypothetical protein DAERI_060089 [Deinococcus aerius]
MTRPTIGRAVHYVLANGQHRAATVVNAWPQAHGEQAYIANLTVQLDQLNDLQSDRVEEGDLSSPNSRAGYARPALVPQGATARTPGTLAVGSAKNDEDAKAPGTWHWPERDE